MRKCVEFRSKGDKKGTLCFFAVIFIFLFHLDQAVNKLSVNHANDILKYILNLIFFFKLVIWDSHYPAKVHPSTKKIKKVILQHAQ